MIFERNVFPFQISERERENRENEYITHFGRLFCFCGFAGLQIELEWFSDGGWAEMDFNVN